MVCKCFIRINHSRIDVDIALQLGRTNSKMNLHNNYTHESVLRTDWYQQSAIKTEEGGSVVPKKTSCVKNYYPGSIDFVRRLACFGASSNMYPFEETKQAIPSNIFFWPSKDCSSANVPH